MSSLLLAVGAILIGFIALMWSADRFVNGAAATARNFGMSPLLIGLTVVSLGTSAPEILVSTIASFNNFPGLAVGNALGSNIANIGLVLAITALVAPLPIHSRLLKRELPLLFLVTLLAGFCLFDGQISLFDSFLLLTSLVATLYLLIRWQKSDPHDALEQEEEDEIPLLGQKTASWLLFSGLVVLLGSSRALVWGATEIAYALGVSDLVIGLTVVAIGTSLPELAASVASALKNHHDIALGNVVGSNIFNLLAVLPVPGLITEFTLGGEVFSRDYLAMLAITALLIGLLFFKRQVLNRFGGTLLLLAYIGYACTLYLMQTNAL